MRARLSGALSRSPQESRYAGIRSKKDGQAKYVDAVGEEEEEADDDGEIHPPAWRTVPLTMPDGSGGVVEMRLLRSEDWIERLDARPGGAVQLTLEEWSISGPATIEPIEPCPAIASGPGRLVTATFTRTTGDVVDLHLEGLDEPIGVTATHKVFSADRGDFIEDEVDGGENARAARLAARLLCPRGSPTLARVAQFPGAVAQRCGCSSDLSTCYPQRRRAATDP